MESKKGAGQGDKYEGYISSTHAIAMGLNHSIYCMYTVKEEDIDDNKILLESKLIKNFNCQDGYLVLIEYQPFVDLIRKGHTWEYQTIGRPVVYGCPTLSLTKDFLSGIDKNNLFIKRPYFKYQKEYRLVFYDSQDPVIIKTEFGARCEWDNVTTIYKVKGDLKNLSRIYKIDDIKAEKGYCIDLSN